MIKLDCVKNKVTFDKRMFAGVNLLNEYVLEDIIDIVYDSTDYVITDTCIDLRIVVKNIFNSQYTKNKNFQLFDGPSCHHFCLSSIHFFPSKSYLAINLFFI